MARVLILGLARSGTTWVGQALSSSEGNYVDEPDNHYRHPFAFRAKAALAGRAYPLLRPGDGAPDYSALWEEAFGLGSASAWEGFVARGRHRAADLLHRGVLPSRMRRGPALVRRAYANGRITPRLAAASRLAFPLTPQRCTGDVVVKSVYAARSADWVAERFPVRVLILTRDLRSVIASWKAAGWLDDPNQDLLDELGPGGGAVLARDLGVPLPQARLTQIGRVAWLLACMASELRMAAGRHPDWTVASYEELAGDAGRQLPELAAALGLGWSSFADAQLRGPLAPHPLPPGIDPRLSEAEAQEIASVLEGFELRGWAW